MADMLLHYYMTILVFHGLRVFNRELKAAHQVD